MRCTVRRVRPNFSAISPLVKSSSFQIATYSRLESESIAIKRWQSSADSRRTTSQSEPGCCSLFPSLSFRSNVDATGARVITPAAFVSCQRLADAKSQEPRRSNTLSIVSSRHFTHNRLARRNDSQRASSKRQRPPHRHRPNDHGSATNQRNQDGHADYHESRNASAFLHCHESCPTDRNSDSHRDQERFSPSHQDAVLRNTGTITGVVNLVKDPSSTGSFTRSTTVSSSPIDPAFLSSSACGGCNTGCNTGFDSGCGC